jgi:DNA (cytosine-5)-methyltransferase 1
LKNLNDNINLFNYEKYKFIDLFAGIGGFHIALNNLKCECVFASEWDIHARKTYEANYKALEPSLFIKEHFVGDITKIDEKNIPSHDILCAGFPCQPFSNAGFKKGFEDTRGTLFFDIARILKEKKPKAYILENVRGLLNHDKGRTFEVIKNTLHNLGYSFHYKVLKASDFNLPQHRPRIYMVGFLKELKDNFQFPNKLELTLKMSDVFKSKSVNKEIGFTLRVGGKGSPLTDRRNWDGYIVDGAEKRIGIEEAKIMQGFPEEFIFPVSKTQAMKQLGNSIAITVVEAIAKNIINELDRINYK